MTAGDAPGARPASLACNRAQVVGTVFGDAELRWTAGWTAGGGQAVGTFELTMADGERHRIVALGVLAYREARQWRTGALVRVEGIVSRREGETTEIIADQVEVLVESAAPLPKLRLVPSPADPSDRPGGAA